MSLQQPRRPTHRSFHFEWFTFAEALVVEALLHHVRGAKRVHPTGHPFPRRPPHPGAVALFDGEPPRRLLVDSPRRVVSGLQVKGGFGKLERLYGEMIRGFQAAHKGAPLGLEFWCFEDPETCRVDVLGKLAPRLPVPTRVVGPERIASDLVRLQLMTAGASPTRDGLLSVLALLRELPG